MLEQAQAHEDHDKKKERPTIATTRTFFVTEYSLADPPGAPMVVMLVSS